MAAIDSIGQLAVHTLEFLAFPRPQLPCSNLVHSLFSTKVPAVPSPVVENLYISPVVLAKILYLKIIMTAILNTKLDYWKRH